MLILLGSANNSVVARWKTLLASKNHLEQAATLETLKSHSSKQKYDLILLHRLLVDIPTCLELRQLAPTSRLFLLSDQPNEQEGLVFLKLGIVGYGNTYISPERLTEAVNVIAAGGVWLGQKVIQQLIMEASASEKEPATHNLEQRFSALTPMERKVAVLVARGLTNLEIAAQLDIVERTVKAHLTAIYEKTHIANRLSLALLINNSS
jgi:DNA-binding NarL/FixJ family response regulator